MRTKDQPLSREESIMSHGADWRKKTLYLAGAAALILPQAAPAHALVNSTDDAAAHGADQQGKAGEKGESGETGESGEAASDAEPWPASRSSKSFDINLDKVFEGEGGEKGWGIQPLEQSVRFPALNDAELLRLFSGNSMVKKGNFAFHFAEDGSVEGFLDGEYAITGNWSVKDAQICINLSTDQITIGCHYVALIVDRIIMFRDNGQPRFTGLIKQGHYSQ